MTKAITLNASLKWPDVKDDYVVRFEEHVVGRIRLGGERYGEGNTWEWSIDIPMEMPAWASGVADGRDACMKDFTAGWGRLLKVTSRERLERAWELERAVAARHQRMARSQAVAG